MLIKGGGFKTWQICWDCFLASFRSPADANTYTPELDTLLDRIIDEHGLIVCGWSGDWDPALRAAITRAPNRRYPMFWAARGQLCAVADTLVQHRAGKVIAIEGADPFFNRLEGLVSAQAEALRPNPRSAELMVASAKKFLAKPEFRIQLDELIEALVCSNSAGKNSENFFYNICNDPQYGFGEYHATTMDNPVLPKRRQNETEAAWMRRRGEFLDDLKAGNDPLVYAQEYLAEFVDWAGVGFFARDKLLDNGQPVPYPARCDGVFAVIDTASKTGTEHDATAVTFFARNNAGGRFPLMILDWDIAQIEGAFLETWLPSVFDRLEELARICRAHHGSLGAFIEDKNYGTILLQQALRRGMPAQAIDSKLTAVGKDERAINVSGYVFRGDVKYTEHAFHKTITYKRRSKNHLMDQVESFRVGDRQ
jgi:hypothetical protein